MVFVAHEALQQGQREGSRLAGAGLRGAHDILPGEHDGNGLRLDGGGLRIAHSGHCALQRLCQGQV